MENYPSSFAFLRINRTWSFHVLVLQMTAGKCTKNYNTRAQLLFSSLNFLFSDVPVAVVVERCFNSLITEQCPSINLPSYVIIVGKLVIYM